MGKENVASSDIRSMSALPDANAQAIVPGKHASMRAVLAGNCNRWMSQHRAVSLAQRAVSLGTVTDAGQNRCVQNNAAFAHNLPTLHMSVVYLYYSRTGTPQHEHSATYACFRSGRRLANSSATVNLCGVEGRSHHWWHRCRSSVLATLAQLLCVPVCFVSGV